MLVINVRTSENKYRAHINHQDRRIPHHFVYLIVRGPPRAAAEPRKEFVDTDGYVISYIGIPNSLMFERFWKTRIPHEGRKIPLSKIYSILLRRSILFYNIVLSSIVSIFLQLYLISLECRASGNIAIVSRGPSRHYDRFSRDDSPAPGFDLNVYGAGDVLAAVPCAGHLH